MTVTDRRRRVVRAVAAIERVPIMAGSWRGVLAFHVRFFGIPQCVTDVTVPTIQRDLRWLADAGFVDRRWSGSRVGRRSEYATTPAGRRWAGVE